MNWELGERQFCHFGTHGTGGLVWSWRWLQRWHSLPWVAVVPLLSPLRNSGWRSPLLDAAAKCYCSGDRYFGMGKRERELHDFGDSSLAIIPITFDDFERWFLIIFRGWNFFGEWEWDKCLYYCACPSPVSALVLKPWIGPGKRWIKSEDSHRIFGFRCSSSFFVSFSSSWWGRLGSGFARVEIFLYRSASLVRSLAQSLVLCQLEFLLALMLILDH